ncbi:cytochrome P450 [Streptomyces libani subsp. rufus]|nr:cytochrome P450 [Streptomyces libani subsp. rufus]
MSPVEPQPRSFPFVPAPRLEEEPLFAELREHEPISRVRLPYGGDAWLVTRYADVKAVLGDPRFGRTATTLPEVPRLQPAPASEGVLMSMDPPDHSRLRRAVAGVFTVRRVNDLRPGAEAIAEQLLDDMASVGAPTDLVTDYALPLPVRVICDLLGVPFADHPKFLEWSDALLSTTARTDQEITAAGEELAHYIAELAAQRRRKPTGDLLSELARIQDTEIGRLSGAEMVALARDLLIAGHETTASQIANFTYALLSHPRELAELRRRPELLPTAVEELLRYVPLGSGAFRCRVATEEVEIGGVLIRPGEAVVAPTVSANRDAEVFVAPTHLDLERCPNPHVAFGFGVHHCLGAQLARMELQVALGALLRRFPDLRLAGAEPDIQWKAGLHIRGPIRLPVQW